MSSSDTLFTHIIGDKSTVYTEVEVDAVDVLATNSEKEIVNFPQSYTDVKKAHHKELLLKNTPLFSEYSELPQSYVAFVDGLLDVCYAKDEQLQLVELCSNLVSVLLSQAELDKELFEKVYSIIPFEDEDITEYILHFDQTGDTPRDIYTVLAFYAAYTLDSLLYEIEKSSNTTDKSDNMKRGERKKTRRSTDEFKVDVDSESGEITREESDSTINDNDNDNNTDNNNTTNTSNLDGSENSEDITTDDSERFIYNNTEDTDGKNDTDPDNPITLLYTFDISEYDSIDTYNEFISVFLKQTAPAITEISEFNSFIREMISLALTNRDSFNEVMESLSGNAPGQDSQDYITIRETYPDIYTNIFIHFLQQYLLTYINTTK